MLSVPSTAWRWLQHHHYLYNMNNLALTEDQSTLPPQIKDLAYESNRGKNHSPHAR